MQERRYGGGDLSPMADGLGADLATGLQARGGARLVDPQQHATLMRIVENEVLPRLLLSLGELSQPVPEPAAMRPTAVAEFADVLLYGDRCAAQGFLRAARQRGMPLAEVYTEVIGPTARVLCERWERDACSFQQVAGGLIRLLSVLREVGGSGH